MAVWLDRRFDVRTDVIQWIYFTRQVPTEHNCEHGDTAYTLSTKKQETGKCLWRNLNL